MCLTCSDKGRATAPFLNGEVEGLVFLGDYVDRGPYSLVNFLFALSLFLAWPEKVILLRGNLEDIEINAIYGFFKELSR